jgi:hypothetical protein
MKEWHASRVTTRHIINQLNIAYVGKMPIHDRLRKVMKIFSPRKPKQSIWKKTELLNLLFIK